MAAQSKRSRRLRVSSYSRQPSPLERTHYSQLIDDLRDARHRAGFTQQQLDHELGVADGLVAKWESFAKLPGAFMLMCWCLSLGLTLNASMLEPPVNHPR